jgi:hypothetical protein
VDAVDTVPSRGMVEDVVACGWEEQATVSTVLDFALDLGEGVS